MIPELNDEATGLDDLDVEEGAMLDPPAQDDLPGVRALMIRLQQLERDEAKIKTTRDAVVAAYAGQLERVERDRRILRSTLQAWIERYGTAKFPDVGTAYLAKGDPKVEVADVDALKDELGDLFTKPTFDLTAAKRYALEEAINGRPIPPGVNVVPGGPRLQIRKS